MDDLRKFVKGALMVILLAGLCGLAIGSCRAVVTLIGRLVGE